MPVITSSEPCSSVPALARSTRYLEIEVSTDDLPVGVDSALRWSDGVAIIVLASTLDETARCEAVAAFLSSMPLAPYLAG